MEREIGPLKCSKLNCYVEFNKMVQALIRHNQKSSHSIPGVTAQHGTSAEYNFYTTLSIMLQQIKSNNVDAQKKELQDLYQWFIINKPYTKPKPKPFAHKPSLRMTSIPAIPSPHSRPQTAPPAFHRQPSFNKPSSHLKRSDESFTRTSTSFASQYMNNSLGSKMNLIGMSLDQLETTGTFRSSPDVSETSAQRKPTTPTRPNVMTVRSFPSPAFLDGPNQTGLPLKPTGTTSKCSSEPQDYSDPSRPMSPSKPKVVSVQSFPSPSFLSGHTPEGHTGLHPELVPQVYLSDVFSLAPQVAAKMVLDREEFEESDFALLRKILKSTAAPTTEKKALPSARSPPVTTPSNTFPSGSPQKREDSSPPLSEHSQIQITSRVDSRRQNRNQSRRNLTANTTQAEHNTQVEEPNSAQNSQLNKVSLRKQNLPDISEETDLSYNLPTQQSDCTGDDASIAEPMPSDVEMSATQLEEVGKLHYNSSNSFSSYRSEHHNPVSRSVTVDTDRIPTPLSQSRSKAKHSVSCSVVSISFEAASNTAVIPTASQFPRTPNRTPNTAAGFRKRRYYRPQSGKLLQDAIQSK